MTQSPSARYDTTIDLSSDSTHAKVVQLVGRNKRLLELGCSTGYMSRVFVEQGCDVVAVEIDADAATRAASFCERVIVADLDQIDFGRELGDDDFDVIVAADVLEHLKDPLRVLLAVKPHLRKEGHLVISVPNIAHASVRLALLSGRFAYRETGLLDETHLRFYTQETLLKLLSDAGFAIDRVERQEREPNESEISFDPSVVPPEVLDSLSRDLDARTYQFVVVAHAISLVGVIQRPLRDSIANKETMERELAEARRALDERGAAAARAAEEVVSLQERLVALQAETVSVQQEREALQHRADAAAAAKETAQRELAEVRRALEEGRAAADRAANEAEERGLAADKAVAETEKAKAEVMQLRRTVDERSRELHELETRLVLASKRERALRDLLLETRDELQHPDPGAGETADETTLTRVREFVDAAAAPNASVGVVTRGDAALLDLGGRPTSHFPQAADGSYGGYYPADSVAAIELLEALREKGTQYLLFPSTGLWWLEHPTYTDFARHLNSRYRLVARENDAGALFDLRRPVADGPRQLTRQPRPESIKGRSRPRAGLAACTIINRNYLPQARILAKSFLEHESDGRFYLLVVDGLPDGETVGADVELVDLDALDLPDVYEMCFKYNVVEFCTAVKPRLLSLILGQCGEESITYFDPDIILFRPLTALRDAMQDGDIVLTPHITKPIPPDGKSPSEQDILISGAYNLGFIALNASPQVDALVHWWNDRLRDSCRIDVPGGLFTDQKWVDLVPGMFPRTVILRDDTYNLAFWNTHERSVERRGERFFINGRPLTFFHASGFDPEKPDVLSKHANRTDVVEGSALAQLLEVYADLLFENGYQTARDWDYGFATFDNGMSVNPILRHLYLSLDSEARARFGNPFRTDGEDSFLDWATRPRPDLGGLSPFLETIYRLRYDVAAAFPEVSGRDRDAFVTWARTQGAKEADYEPELVRVSDAEPSLWELTTSAPSLVPPHGSSADYQQLVARIRSVVDAVLPPAKTVLVVSKGDNDLLKLGARDAWHFPRTEDGVYAGYYPNNGRTAISHLEALRKRGAEYLVFPATSLWWLDHPKYAEFKEHLEAEYHMIHRVEGTCVIFGLSEAAEPGRSVNGEPGHDDIPLWKRLLGRWNSARDVIQPNSETWS